MTAAMARLRYMSDAHSEPEDRTPMWTLDELWESLRTTPATVCT